MDESNSDQSSDVSSAQSIETEFKICSPSLSSSNNQIADGDGGGGGNNNNGCSSTKQSSVGSHNNCSSSTPSSSASSTSNFQFRSSLLSSSSTSSSTGACADSSSSKPFVLNPPRLSNPFLKPLDDDKEQESVKDNQDKPSSTNSKQVLNNDACKPSSTTSSSSGGVGPTVVSFLSLGSGAAGSNNETTTNKGGFSNPSQAPSSISNNSSSIVGNSFIFGQNLRDKVEAPKPADEVSSSSDCSSSEPNFVNEEPKSNGTTSEMLFTSAVKSGATPNKDNKSQEGSSSKSLSEAAREYEEARAIKRKFEEVQVITGEEHESNVLQMNCKLFAYVKSAWQERGRGTLRLNDIPCSHQSRVIIRAAGSLRLLLNTLVWSGMSVQRASPKSLRLTAMDSNSDIRVFLVSASQKEIDQLERYLETRVSKLKKIPNEDPVIVINIGNSSSSGSGGGRQLMMVGEEESDDHRRQMQPTRLTTPQPFPAPSSSSSLSSSDPKKAKTSDEIS